MSPPAAFREIADSLAQLDDWEDRYRYIIELGQGMPGLVEGERTEANRVQGCVSQVWLVHGTERREGQVIVTYRGESDAAIVRGLVAVLLALYSGRPAAEIAETDAFEFFDGLALSGHLTTQRSNGLVSMISNMRARAREGLTDS